MCHMRALDTVRDPEIGSWSFRCAQGHGIPAENPTWLWRDRDRGSSEGGTGRDRHKVAALREGEGATSPWPQVAHRPVILPELWKEPSPSVCSALLGWTSELRAGRCTSKLLSMWSFVTAATGPRAGGAAVLCCSAVQPGQLGVLLTQCLCVHTASVHLLGGHSWGPQSVPPVPVECNGALMPCPLFHRPGSSTPAPKNIGQQPWAGS